MPHQVVLELGERIAGQRSRTAGEGAGVDDARAAGDPVERLVRDGAGTDVRVTGGPMWLMVVPAGLDLPEHGWKLHVSSRVAAFPSLVELVLPVLAAVGCAFKLARSRQVLARINDGLTAPATVGKAITIYPDQRRVRELGQQLAERLDGWPGPRVLSDRRVTASAPVYYRYGQFVAAWKADGSGRLKSTLRGPDGEVFDGTATLDYRQPSWVVDPFTGVDGQAAEPGDGHQAAVLGGHYQVTTRLRRAAPGDVYQAVDRRDGSVVVVKQARALVAEDPGNADSRLRLRNERRVLTALSGVPGVPRLLDHFRHADDEFLVTSHCGPVNLADDVLRHGVYPVEDAGPRGLGALAAGLARIVGDLHGRGVIVRDLSPKNVVIGDAGASLVDFGIAACDGLHLPGATPGYALAPQWRNEPPAVAGDYFALGMTLLFAATGLEPVTLGDDYGLPRIRALQTIRAAHGERPTGIIGLVAGLLGADERAVRASFEHLASGAQAGGRATAAVQPAAAAVGEFTQARAVEITAVLLADLVRDTTKLLQSPASQQAAHDASVYRGSAGIGLELLHHLGAAGVAGLLADLAAFTVAAAQRVGLPPGLFLGRTGVSFFLHQAAANGIPVPATVDYRPGPDWEPEGDDLVAGAAGAGLGHLWLFRATGDRAHLEVAIRCGRGIVSGATPASPFLSGGQSLPSVDPAAGRAHGLAGVAEFLLALAAQTGDEATAAEATHRVSQLAQRARHLIAETGRPAAAPIAVSWCQGLAGIGQTLLHASAVLGDPSLARLAGQAADACIAYTPRLSVLARCCGAAGVGSFLLDLAGAGAGAGDRYRDAACDVARQMLLRSGGPDHHPVFVQDTSEHSGLAWSFGLAGLLPFFRRLANPGEPDSLPFWPAVPA